jgi:hypothetical protein
MKPRAYRVARSQPDFVPFPDSLSGLTSPPAPVPLRVRVHPLLSSTSPSEYSPFRTCPSLSLGAPSLEFPFPIATSTRGVHLRASIPGSPYVPPPAFLTPSTACSSSCFAGLFHPAATSGIHLSGVRSRCPAWVASSAPRPLLSLPAFSCLRVAPAAPDPTASPSGSSSGQRSEAIDRVISPGDASIPS